MKEIKKYIDVIRYGKSQTEGVIKEGDHITITEKIDCANASFRLDETNPLGVSCYSRNIPVTEENRLNGFYDWVLTNIVPIKEKLREDCIYYGEWTGTRHKVAYKDEVMKKFWMFSIWDIELEMYIRDIFVQSEAEKLGISTVPYFYEGEFISFDHLMSFVGKSELTLEPNTGEGIVVKNVSYFDRFGKQCFVKLVSEKFAEVQKQKLPKNPNVKNGLVSVVMSCLTEARVDKMLHKLVDEDILPEDYTVKDIGLILRSLGNRIYEDIIKEESEMFIEYEENEIKRTIGKNMPNIVKTILNNK